MLTTIPVQNYINRLNLNEMEISFIIVMGLYYSNRISLGKAAEILQISYDELLDKMKDNNLYVNYDYNDLQHDLKMAAV